MKTILVLTNFSQKSKHAAEYALHIACKIKANILLTNALTESVQPDTSLLPIADFARDLDYSQSKLMDLAEDLSFKVQLANTEFKPVISYQTKVGELGKLGLVISEIVTEKNIWMIIMGENEDGSLSNFIYGTNAYSVISHCNCPVLFVPPRGEIKDISQIVIPSEQPEFEEEPVRFLQEFAQPFHGDIFESQMSLDSGRLRQFVKAVPHDNIIPRAPRHCTDILVLVYKKCDVFKKMFHSITANILIDYPHTSLLVYPGMQTT